MKMLPAGGIGMSARLPAHLASASIDIDEHNPAVANGLQPIGHCIRIIFRTKVLHARFAGQYAPFDIAQRLHVAAPHIASHLVLFIGPLLRQRRRRDGSEQGKGGKGCGPTHDKNVFSPPALNEL